MKLKKTDISLLLKTQNHIHSSASSPIHCCSSMKPEITLTVKMTTLLRHPALLLGLQISSFLMLFVPHISSLPPGCHFV